MGWSGRGSVGGVALAVMLGLGSVLSGCGLNLDLDPPDQGGGGMDGGTGSGDAGGQDAAPSCEGDSCDDGDPCNGVETCTLTGCVAGTPLVCDDMIDCTEDHCEEGVGCKAAANDDLCDRAPGGTCDVSEGGCQYEVCDDTTCVGSPCVRASCAGTTCEYRPECKPDQICCDDSCYAADCDDNPCTDDVCVDGMGCVSTPNMHGCDDGDACTAFDTCYGGACMGAPLGCDDDDPCTRDSCDPSDGACVNDVEAANGDLCEDGNACTTGDACMGGSCVPTGGISCADDDNVCTADACDPRTGLCHTPVDDGACSDDNPCTTGDTCAGGRCVGRPAALGTSCGTGRACSGATCCPMGQGDCDGDGICECDGPCTAGTCGGDVSCVAPGASCLATERCCPGTGDCYDRVSATCPGGTSYCMGVVCLGTQQCCCDGTCRLIGSCPLGCGPPG